MKKTTFYILIVTVLLPSVCLFGQNNTGKITWGPISTDDKGLHDWGMIGNAKDGFVRIFEQIHTPAGSIIIANGSHGHYDLRLRGMNAEMKPTLSSIFDEVKLQNEAYTEAIIQMKNNAFWVYTTRANKKTQFYVYKINIKSASLEGSPILIGESEMHAHPISPKISMDSSRLLILYSQTLLLEDEDKVGVIVFDQQSLKSNSFELHLAPAKSKTEIYDSYIDRTGRVFILANVNKYHEKNFMPVLFKFDNKASSPESIPVDIGDKKLQSLRLSEDSKGNINILGYYYHKDTYIIQGLFMTSLNPTSNSFDKIKKGNYEIPEEYILLKEPARAKKKSAKGVQDITADKLRTDDMEVTSLIDFSDGSITVMGESRHSFFNAQASFQCFGDIIIVHIKPNGDLAWIKSIPKDQKFQKDEGGGIPAGACSYKSLIEGNNLYVIYQDDPRNDSADPKEIPETYFGGITNLYCLKFDDSGQMTKTILQKTKDYKV